MHKEAVGAAQKAVQPEDVDRLEHDQQPQGDKKGERAFILLRLPVELVGADSLELGEERIDEA